jgi:hypothetical protein
MQLSLDVFVRDILPEVKLALGEQIDRENARSLPGRYAKLLPETLLLVTLRPDVAEAITPVAAEIEQELTNSCSRHGSLYDRVYRVQLRRAEERDAALFSVAAHAGHDLAVPGRPEEGPPTAAVASPASGEALHAPLLASDPDATRVQGMEPTPGWDAGRWVMVVEDEQGTELEAFRLVEPFTTVGRRSDDPDLRVGVALSGVPHVSRRQLALLWDGATTEPGFRVYNLGLNPLHVDDQVITGARLGRGALRLDEIGSAHSTRITPDVPVRIGEHGPILRIQEVPAPAEEEEDPEATRYE